LRQSAAALSKLPDQVLQGGQVENADFPRPDFQDSLPGEAMERGGLRRDTGARFDSADARLDRLTTEMHDEFDKVHVELEAIKELLVLRKEFENLVREIKARGNLDETRIFVR
jgi:hypothetical protein